MKQEALTYLRKSAEVVTGKRAYIDLISSIYYPEDGFNDRSLHMAQAFQTFAYENTKKIIKAHENDQPRGSGSQAT